MKKDREQGKARGKEIEELNIEQRKGMRIALGICYPAKIGNIAIYERMGTEPISMKAIRMRWELFSKVLRGQEEDPALRVMKDYYKGQAQRPKYIGGEKTSMATIIKKESGCLLTLGSKPRVRIQPQGQVDTLLSLNRYQKVAKMRNNEKWREVIEEVVGNAKQKWRNDEIERHNKRVAYREQRDMRKEEKQEQDHRREVNMESEAVLQLMLGVTRLTIQERREIDKDSAEIRQLEREMGQMSIQILEIATTIGNTTGGIEGYKRRVQFTNERER